MKKTTTPEINNADKYKALEESYNTKGIVYNTIVVEDSVFFVKHIAIHNLLSVGQLLTENKMIQAFNIILNDIFLGGDRDIFDDTDVFLATMPLIMEDMTPHDIEIAENLKESKVVSYSIKIPVDDIEYTCELKKMDIATLSKVFEFYNKNNVFAALNVILEKCWVSGDTEIKTNPKLFMSTMAIVEKMISPKIASIKKN